MSKSQSSKEDQGAVTRSRGNRSPQLGGGETAPRGRERASEGQGGSSEGQRSSTSSQAQSTPTERAPRGSDWDSGRLAKQHGMAFRAPAVQAAREDTADEMSEDKDRGAADSPIWVDDSASEAEARDESERSDNEVTRGDDARSEDSEPPAMVSGKKRKAAARKKRVAKVRQLAPIHTEEERVGHIARIRNARVRDVMNRDILGGRGGDFIDNEMFEKCERVLTMIDMVRFWFLLCTPKSKKDWTNIQGLQWGKNSYTFMGSSDKFVDRIFRESLARDIERNPYMYYDFLVAAEAAADMGVTCYNMIITPTMRLELGKFCLSSYNVNSSSWFDQDIIPYDLSVQGTPEGASAEQRARARALATSVKTFDHDSNDVIQERYEATLRSIVADDNKLARSAAQAEKRSTRLKRGSVTKSKSQRTEYESRPAPRSEDGLITKRMINEVVQNQQGAESEPESERDMDAGATYVGEGPERPQSSSQEYSYESDGEGSVELDWEEDFDEPQPQVSAPTSSRQELVAAADELDSSTMWGMDAMLAAETEVPAPPVVTKVYDDMVLALRFIMGNLPVGAMAVQTRLDHFFKAVRFPRLVDTAPLEIWEMVESTPGAWPKVIKYAEKLEESLKKKQELAELQASTARRLAAQAQKRPSKELELAFKDMETKQQKRVHWLEDEVAESVRLKRAEDLAKGSKAGSEEIDASSTREEFEDTVIGRERARSRVIEKGGWYVVNDSVTEETEGYIQVEVGMVQQVNELVVIHWDHLESDSSAGFDMQSLVSSVRLMVYRVARLRAEEGMCDLHCVSSLSGGKLKGVISHVPLSTKLVKLIGGRVADQVRSSMGGNLLEDGSGKETSHNMSAKLLSQYYAVCRAGIPVSGVTKATCAAVAIGGLFLYLVTIMIREHFSRAFPTLDKYDPAAHRRFMEDALSDSLAGEVKETPISLSAGYLTRAKKLDAFNSDRKLTGLLTVGLFWSASGENEMTPMCLAKPGFAGVMRNGTKLEKFYALSEWVENFGIFFSATVHHSIMGRLNNLKCTLRGEPIAEDPYRKADERAFPGQVQSPDRAPNTFRFGPLNSLSADAVGCHIWSAFIAWWNLVKSGAEMANGLRCITPEVCVATLSEMARVIMLDDTVSATAYYTRYGEDYEKLMRPVSKKAIVSHGDAVSKLRSPAKVPEEVCYSQFARRVFPSKPACKNPRCRLFHVSRRATFTENEFSDIVNSLKLTKGAQDKFQEAYKAADSDLRG
jgi:hypothetical protein